MGNFEKILIGTGAAMAVVATYFFIKNKSSSTVSNTTNNGTNNSATMSVATKGNQLNSSFNVSNIVKNISKIVPPPAAPDPSSNNYFMYTYEIIKTLNNTGNAQAASVLSQQLKTAWNSGDSVPVFSDANILAVKGTLPNGYFDNPQTIGSVSGQSAMLQQVCQNAVILLCTIAMNYVQQSVKGQAIGAFQNQIRQAYNNAKGNFSNANLIPTSIAPIIVYFNNYASGNWSTGQAKASDTAAILSGVGILGSAGVNVLCALCVV